jgi:hypothetical protein
LVKFNSAPAAAEMWDLRGCTLKIKLLASWHYENMYVECQTQIIIATVGSHVARI